MAAPITAPTGPPTAPPMAAPVTAPPAAPTPVPTGCAPGAPVMGSGLASCRVSWSNSAVVVRLPVVEYLSSFMRVVSWK